IPSFDIPAAQINDDSRQFRLSDGSTTDDHCLHLVGYLKTGDEYWFMVKDSGSGGFDGTNKGYRFYHQDYVRLKMMNILIHKDPAKTILDKIIK
ncbi:MAG: peptidase C1, partial [Bacteroidetes bacterium]|nr:peptidase C1 [Bacteroidota bacterium]